MMSGLPFAHSQGWALKTIFIVKILKFFPNHQGKNQSWLRVPISWSDPTGYRESAQLHLSRD